MFKLILTVALISFSSTTNNLSPSDDTYVYMCVNGKTEVYHVNRNCRGMKQCKHTIKKMTLKAAKEKELRLCGFED